MLRSRVVSLLLMLAPASPLLAQAARSNKLTLDLFLESERAGSPQISPDARQIVYTRGWVDKINDRWESSLWIMNVDGAKERFLVDGSGAKWSPDGAQVAYTARGEPSGSQICRGTHRCW